MTAEPRAFRWDLLPRVERREQALVAAFAGCWPRRSLSAEAVPAALAPLALRTGPVRAYDRHDLGERLHDPTAVAAVLRRPDGHVAYAAAAGSAIAAAAAALLAGQADEISAPRAPTVAERGVAVYLAAAALERYGVAGQVDAQTIPAAAVVGRLADPWALGVDVTMTLGSLCVPAFVLASERVAAAAPAPTPLASLLGPAASRLEGVRCEIPLVSGGGRLGIADLDALAVRDVVLLDEAPRQDRGRLALSAGWFPVELTEGRAAVSGDYQRGNAMNEAIADDVTVELACQLGTATMTARQVLELAPGQVLDLSRPLGGPVDLVAGGKLIGRGELVDVDGELGVRVTTLSREP